MVNPTPPPRHTLKEQVPIVKESGWSPGTDWKGSECLVPLGFDPTTVQSVASRYTDCAVPVHVICSYLLCCNKNFESYLDVELPPPP